TALAPEERVKCGLVRTFQINTLFPHLSALEAVTLAVCERRGYAGSWWRKLPAYADAVEEAYAILQSLRLAAGCYWPTPEPAHRPPAPRGSAGPRAPTPQGVLPPSA